MRSPAVMRQLGLSHALHMHCTASATPSCVAHTCGSSLFSMIGFAGGLPGIVGALCGILACVASSILMCCAPKSTEEGGCKFTAVRGLISTHRLNIGHCHGRPGAGPGDRAQDVRRRQRRSISVISLSVRCGSAPADRLSRQQEERLQRREQQIIPKCDTFQKKEKKRYRENPTAHSKRKRRPEYRVVSAAHVDAMHDCASC